jgi:predicted PurR-regulated permease PerM
MPSSDERLSARSDLAWAIAVGGIATVLFAALLSFAWHFAATLFLIFAGMLLGVALNAMTQLLGRLIRLPQPLRLAIVCLALAALPSGVVVLGGTTIAKQATTLSDTIKSQLGKSKPWRRPQLFRVWQRDHDRIRRRSHAGHDDPG